MAFIGKLFNRTFTRSIQLNNGYVAVKHRPIFWKRLFAFAFGKPIKRNFAKHLEGKPQFIQYYIDGEPVIPINYNTTEVIDGEFLHVIMYSPSYIDEDGEPCTEM